MKKLFIGHRGVGKTSLLKRHQQYFPSIPHFDLDEEIEKLTGVSVSSYFKEHGEAEFRKIEHATFKKLISENLNLVISLGAGFETSLFPSDFQIVFVSRITDKDGRIFLNRPRLESSLSALDEYQKRYLERHNNYLKRATQIYDLPEGIESANQIEKSMLTSAFYIEGAYYTLTPSDLVELQQRLSRYSKIELRTDLLDEATISDLLSQHPHHDWLVSIRNESKVELSQARSIDADFLYASTKCHILSSHADNIDEGILQLTTEKKLHLKLCPFINNFDELIKGFEWQQLDPENRSFLPRSSDGRWLWYRQLCKYLQKINFVKNFTRIDDQPSVFEWLCLPSVKPDFWAAVLGQPVYFSRSPMQHLNYFTDKKTFFTKVQLNEDELKNNIKFLIKLGLKYAAVTSPLKETANLIADVKTELGAANTLMVHENELHSTNTDLAGFIDLVQKIKMNERVAIWGGGGTLDMMKSVLPHADLYSSQTGKLRHSETPADLNYDYLIWAAPRKPSTVFPSESFKIKQIIDLNYTENSMGLEFAERRRINYTSGLQMFKVQALKQQEFWSQNERK